MSDLVTLIRRIDAAPSPAEPPAGLAMRSSRPADLAALGALYFAAYDPGIACDTLEEAVADVAASFAGEYGEYWPEASPVVTSGGRIVNAVMTVRRAPWDDTPDCPFIIELFTARDHRRRGLGRLAVTSCMRTVAAAGEQAVALRVAVDNRAALALYRSLGFARWPEQAVPEPEEGDET